MRKLTSYLVLIVGNDPFKNIVVNAVRIFPAKKPQSRVVHHKYLSAFRIGSDNAAFLDMKHFGVYLVLIFQSGFKRPLIFKLHSLFPVNVLNGVYNVYKTVVIRTADNNKICSAPVSVGGKELIAYNVCVSHAPVKRGKIHKAEYP